MYCGQRKATICLMAPYLLLSRARIGTTCLTKPTNSLAFLADELQEAGSISDPTRFSPLFAPVGPCISPPLPAHDLASASSSAASSVSFHSLKYTDSGSRSAAAPPDAFRKLSKDTLLVSTSTIPHRSLISSE